MEPRFSPYTVYKTLTHQVPEAVDYQIMVPQKKTVQFTVYKTFEEKEKATWCMLIPYFTEKGRDALKNVLGEGYLNELGADFSEKQTGSRII